MYIAVSVKIVADLVMNGVRSYAHATTHAIFSLDVRLSRMSFSITDLLNVHLSHV